MEDRVIVDFDALDRIAGKLKTAGSELESAGKLLSASSLSSAGGAYLRLSDCGASLQTIGGCVSAGTVAQAVASYRAALNRISAYSSNLASAVSTTASLFRSAESGSTTAATAVPVGAAATIAAVAATSPMWDWLGYELDDGSVTAWLGKASASGGDDYLSGEVNAYLGKAKAEAKLKASLMKGEVKKEYKNGEWTEKEVFTVLNLEAAAGASASVLSADATASAGNNWLGSELKVEGSAGNASVEAKGQVSVGEDGINAVVKGEAMVSAVEGEVSGTVTILGIEFTAKAGGYAGAVGVEGKAGIENNKLVVEGGVAAIFGGSVGFEIGLSDETWDFITDTVDTITDGVSDFVDFLTFWD